MITAFLSLLIYLGIGWTFFRGWVKLSPPKKAEYVENVDIVFSGSRKSATWYIPAIIQTPTVYYYGQKYDRGMALQQAMWWSILGWPIVFFWGIATFSVIGLTKVFKKLNAKLKEMSESLAVKSLPEHRPLAIEEPDVLVAAEIVKLDKWLAEDLYKEHHE